MANIMTKYKIGPNSSVLYQEKFISNHEEIFNILKEYMPTEKHKVMIFGSLVEIPRLQLCYGKSYNFSGTTSNAIDQGEMPIVIQNLLQIINNHYMLTKQTNKPIYNMCLVNFYRNGDEYIGYHSDDEKQIKNNTPIYSITLGATRKFKLKSKKEDDNLFDLDLEPVSGSLLIMDGDCQKTHKHSVPKQKNINDMRINLTFRAFD